MIILKCLFAYIVALAIISLFNAFVHWITGDV